MRVNPAFLPFVHGLEPWLSHYRRFSHKKASRHQLHCFSMAQKRQKGLKFGSVTFPALNQYISIWLAVLCSCHLTLQLSVKPQVSTGVSGALPHSQTAGYTWRICCHQTHPVSDHQPLLPTTISTDSNPKTFPLPAFLLLAPKKEQSPLKCIPNIEYMRG